MLYPNGRHVRYGEQPRPIPCHAFHVEGGLCVARPPHEDKWSIYHVASGARVIPPEAGVMVRNRRFHGSGTLDLDAALGILASLLRFHADWSDAPPPPDEVETGR